MKIHYLLTGLDFGGAERQVRDLSIGMRRRGHDVGVTCLLTPRAFVDELQSEGVQVSSLEISRAQWTPWMIASAFGKARSLLRKRRPELIHAHMVHANLFSRLVVTTLPGSKLICTAHNITEGGRLRDMAYKATGYAAALNTTISEAATRRFLSAGALPPNTVTVYNGVDCQRFAHSRPRSTIEGPFRWLAIGRLEQQKDYPTLIRAISSLDDSCLDIVGQGPLLRELQELASRLNVSDRVRFLGLVPNIAEIMDRYDGFVLSSAWEGFGLVIVEAMAAGLPVVVTDAGGPSEIIGHDGRAGMLVPVRDQAALAESMAALMKLGPEERCSMGECGRKRVRSLFDLEKCLDIWESIYQSVTRGLPVVPPEYAIAEAPPS